MEETYTYQPLVKYLYHEMPACEAIEMANMIEEDEFLHEEFQNMQQAKSQLPKALFNPSKNTVSNILNYSSRTAMLT
ncbi:MAG: hypothetical protein R3A50_15135 [Saprospiraceae bacterium]|nr:hypothetical protein [Saprospiraceae bacterium]MCB9344344.1 hypothetical protein [Lewinellaceae bacterium]